MAWRQPLPNESRLAAIGFGTLSLIVFATLNYHEIRKNTVFQPAECSLTMLACPRSVHGPLLHILLRLLSNRSPALQLQDGPPSLHQPAHSRVHACRWLLGLVLCLRFATSALARRALAGASSRRQMVVESHLEVAMFDGQVLNMTHISQCRRSQEDATSAVELGWRPAGDVGQVEPAGAAAAFDWRAAGRQTYSQRRCVDQLMLACQVAVCHIGAHSFRSGPFRLKRLLPELRHGRAGRAGSRAEVNATPVSIEQHVNQRIHQVGRGRRAVLIASVATQGRFVAVGTGSHSRVVTVHGGTGRGGRS